MTITAERLHHITNRFAELEARMASGTLEGEAFVQASRDYSELEPIATIAGEIADMRAEMADLSALVGGPCNDMVVDAQGGAYVGNFGFNRHGGEEPRSTTLVRVTPEGATSIAADGLWFPNGTVITPDGKTLVVAETRAERLTAFDIAGDGSLSNRRVFAETAGLYPDGICLDAEGAIWVTDPHAKEIIRFRDGGEITERIKLEGGYGPYACMLGGDDLKTLFVCTNLDSGPEIAEGHTGRIEITQVDVQGAGLP